MNKLHLLKIALLIVILVEEIKRAISGQKVRVNLKITNIDEFKDAIKENNISAISEFKPILDQD
ncbi:hypothetical protein [Macrococcus armenti]|uniref:hypothetical protein n=1 Tax=Macrococcus armenti TaxID=2875764 RepID=UPI001CCD0531|nr:hypothetical protein [Macrococcus armenti]UBH14881.1 hypothetical protein LAU44_08935 [Macrococcus armenti]UBH17241.1 hypothetical protein LAU39_08965 [Macrococcus armenti]UBH19506.1 hypothetical protein LAU40_08945 [Macrococcus armenti]